MSSLSRSFGLLSASRLSVATIAFLFCSNEAVAEDPVQRAAAFRIDPATIDTRAPDRYTRWLESTRDLTMPRAEAAELTRRAFVSTGFEVFSQTDQLGFVRSSAKPVPVPGVCDCGALQNGLAISGQANLFLYATLDESGEKGSSIHLESECATQFGGQRLVCASVATHELNFWRELDHALDLATPSLPEGEALPPQ